MNNENEIKKEIIPTVMPFSYDDFLEKIDLVYSFAKTIQIDVMDGNFVSSVSWPYNSKNDVNWEKLIKQEEGIPHWDKCDFEIDLMVKNQIEEANKWIDAGVMRIIGHYEAFFIGKDSGQANKDILNFIDLKNQRGVEVYMAINPQTDLEKILEFIDNLDGVQFMGIERVGYQGEPFAEIILEKISALRKIKPEINIAVDGGVNFETAVKIIGAGANKLSCGSVIFKSSNPKQTFEELQNI